MEIKDNLIFTKSKKFALAVIGMYKDLVFENKEYILSKQILKSGTSIGANISESIRAQSKMDFVSKLSISLKEAQETLYWLDLLFEGNYISSDRHYKLYNACEELVRLLVSSINTAKRNKFPQK